MGTRKTVQTVSPERLAALHAGAACTHLTEQLALDFALLMQSSVPRASAQCIAALQKAAGSGVTRRMQLAGSLLHKNLGLDGLEALASHTSDTVRGWACYLLAAAPALSLADLLERVRPLADDGHFAVREWAWLALRTLLAAELMQAIALLQPWTQEKSENLRRFASEALRPRGVWCAHIAALKETPEIALPLLEPLRADESTYVQDSVANWLNDASKTRPDWVRSVCARWQQQSPGPTTARICRRALRSVGE